MTLETLRGRPLWRLVGYEVRWFENRRVHSKGFGADLDAAKQFAGECERAPERMHAELFRTEALSRRGIRL